MSKHLQFINFFWLRELKHVDKKIGAVINETYLSPTFYFES